MVENYLVWWFVIAIRLFQTFLVRIWEIYYWKFTFVTFTTPMFIFIADIVVGLLFRFLCYVYWFIDWFTFYVNVFGSLLCGQFLVIESSFFTVDPAVVVCLARLWRFVLIFGSFWIGGLGVLLGFLFGDVLMAWLLGWNIAISIAKLSKAQAPALLSFSLILSFSQPPSHPPTQPPTHPATRPGKSCQANS